jgi:protein-arginine deiminase
MTDKRRSFAPKTGRAAISTLAVFVLAILTTFGATLNSRQTVQDRQTRRIIIPNIDDDDSDGRPDFRADVHNGAIDDELLQVHIAPDAALPEGTVLTVAVPKAWEPFIRIFKLDPSDKMFRPIPNPLGLTSGDAGRHGIELGIETSAFAGPGRSREIEIGLRFATKAGVLISKKAIACSVAPFVMSSCLDPVDAVHVVHSKLTERFVNDLKPLIEAAGAPLLSFENAALPEHDIWIQDATEIGSAADGERMIPVALHGNRGMRLDDSFAKSFLGKDSGVVHPGNFRGKSAQWIDWFGNLEVSPPLATRHRSCPNGRIYTGTQGVRAMHPDVISFLEAQGVQTPVLWLDTSWLVIGHVDETVSWVPADVGSAFRMLLPSPRLALEILRKAEKAAPGCILNRGTKRNDSEKDEFCDAPVAAVLNDRTLLAGQEFVQKKIEGVRRTLQAELEITDSDIIEIPVLFNSWPGRFAGRYGALTANMVNSLLIGKTLIVPDPHGPLVNGTDVLLQAVKDRLEPLGCKVVAIDDFYPYHRYGGEVHCGTNATRHPSVSR